ncbi:signal peptide peptidase SppA [Pseudolysobacter antarcticus]|uniref:Signal peptide peptidase SppA n=1 Tax=Pseudolysobacter antarcticus TaxID=2511995 RepID=A0A411HFB3_9GAMM|nr:signal peptide peptidase SppA [Pseudolysobacter antarcticus]QBB69180.1 signal peptide peptidase SppA [Pseudolysobacter antarcticus]
MAEQRPNIIVRFFRINARFFRALWNTVNFTRRLVFNLIFVFLLVIFFSAMFAKAPRIAERTALVVDPKGAIVEQFTAAPAQRALDKIAGNERREVQLRDLVHALDSAAKDTRIERVVFIPDEISSVGQASSREIAAALDRVKTAGKEVITVSNGMSQSQYLLAAHSTQILLHPDGAVLLEGLGRYHTYYKEALDKLGVDVHVFRVGEYKSAVEPYMLDHGSAEAKEADLFWMSSVWNDYLADVGTQRKIAPATLQSDIEHYPELLKASAGDLADVALKQKLVDQLATRDQARDLLIAKGVKDEAEHTFRQIDLRDYLSQIEHDNLGDMRPEIGVVVAEGEMSGAEQPAGAIGGESTARLLREAREDENLKAIVLRVNSPGGEAFVSEVIRREVELTRKAGKPIVVSMGDVAASGGYWISMNADEIWAEPNTITGSIGIFGLFMNIPNTLAKIGIHADGVGTTSLAGAFDVRLPLDPKVGALIQSVIDKGYQNFIGKVAAARGKTAAQIDLIARGRVWSGIQAKERGLVDQLGGLREATASAAKRAHLGDDYRVTYVEKEQSTWERFALSLSSEAQVKLGLHLDFGLPAALFANQEIRQQLRLLSSLQNNKPGVFAYCFCEIK